MNIEILTTKKKLTKSIIKQLKPATFSDMRHAISFDRSICVGYHIRGLPGPSNKIGLFMGVNEWCVFDILDWKKCKTMTAISASNPKGEGDFIRRYETKEELDMFISTYDKIKDLCNKNHLIL